MRASQLVHVDADRTTNGQRFWLEIAERLNQSEQRIAKRVALFNVSASLADIAAARLAGRRVVLRVDGIYFDRLSREFIGQFAAPVRPLLSAARVMGGEAGFGAFMANFVQRNYGPFAKMALASHVVYQSRFSARAYQRFFSRLPSTVILNGSEWRGSHTAPAPGPIRLVTVYDPWRISKRLSDAIRFVRWAREERKLDVELRILGYNPQRRPADLSDELTALVQSAPYITTRPPFREIDPADLRDAHAYLSLTYRDACPNAIIEVMAHGIPVIGVASGGVPEIAGDAGTLIPSGESEDRHYVAHRFEIDFPPIDRESLLRAVQDVVARQTEFRERVQRRFVDDLGIEVAVARYADLAEREARARR